MGDGAPFTYTDEQWAAVAAELPDGAPWVRQLLEYHARGYIAQVNAGNGKAGRSYKQSQAAWRRIADTARQLQRDIDTIGQHPLEIIYAFDRADHDKLESFVVSLPWFIDRADAMVARLAKWDAESDGRANNIDVERNHYLEMLMHEWQAQDRLLQTSTRSKDGTATGPLVRFLNAASAPVFNACGKRSPTPGVLRGVVRKHGDSSAEKNLN